MAILKHAVVRIDGSATGRSLMVTVITPWSYNRALAERSHEEHQKQETSKIFGILTIPDPTARRKG